MVIYLTVTYPHFYCDQKELMFFLNAMNATNAYRAKMHKCTAIQYYLKVESDFCNT